MVLLSKTETTQVQNLAGTPEFMAPEVVNFEDISTGSGSSWKLRLFFICIFIILYFRHVVGWSSLVRPPLWILALPCQRGGRHHQQNTCQRHLVRLSWYRPTNVTLYWSSCIIQQDCKKRSIISIQGQIWLWCWRIWLDHSWSKGNTLLCVVQTFKKLISKSNRKEIKQTYAIFHLPRISLRVS